MISAIHKERMETMQAHCLYHRPTDYWNTVNAALISHVALLNGADIVVLLEVLVGQEKLFYSVDRTAWLSINGRIEDIRDRSMLSILASTFEALSRELRDTEWDYHTRANKQRKMLQRAEILIDF